MLPTPSRATKKLKRLYSSHSGNSSISFIILSISLSQALSVSYCQGLLRRENRLGSGVVVRKWISRTPSFLNVSVFSTLIYKVPLNYHYYYVCTMHIIILLLPRSLLQLTTYQSPHAVSPKKMILC